MEHRFIEAPGAALSGVKADALLVVLTTEHHHTGDKAVDALIDDAVKHGDLALKAGRSLFCRRPMGAGKPHLVLVVAAQDGAKAFKSAVAKGLASVKDLAVAHVAVVAADGLALQSAHARALVQAADEATYVYRQTKPSAPAAGKLRKVSLVGPKASASALGAALKQAQAQVAGVALARELGNLPGNHCTPSHLAVEARKLAREYKHISAQVLERPALEKLGMGSFLSVTNGSAQPPKFIILRYEGAAASQAPVVLVGKGITFDTGGISLKPGAGMDEMKFDMGGAASVLGTFRALAELKPRINVVGLVPTCENMPSGTATKPGDVVTSMSGQTIEILNTDAEGRLILCDALTYAERLKPAVVVDIATLTGACVIALGGIHSGLFSRDDELAQALLSAGQDSGDTAWRMPLDEEYGDALKSNFADIANVGGREAGSVTAACFLAKFTQAYRWAHLDIAGTAWKSGGTKGGTGRPVMLLSQFILDQAAAGKQALAPQAKPARKPTRAPKA
ncbi:leucyl aminopeptidase [Aquabacterium sp. A3]|uniref:leucyl aminopeptidase n=1 Tax=Aquabacterium sp. A3 TaxID=3132829 RepID=UPI003119917F